MLFLFCVMAQWFGRLPLLQWPCCQSSWASAFKKLLEAFKLTVTSNRAFVLFLGQLSVVGSTIKLAIRKIWLTMAISWQNHVAKDLIVIWQTVHGRKLKLVSLSFIFCSRYILYFGLEHKMKSLLQSFQPQNLIVIHLAHGVCHLFLARFLEN